MRVYCGLASAGQRIPVAVVDDAGRILASDEVDDTPAGYAAIRALIADHCADTGPIRTAMATDNETSLVSLLLAAAGDPLAVGDAGTIAPFVPNGRQGGTEPQDRAVALARALHAGTLAASTQPAPRDLTALRPVLAAHRAAATGRSSSVGMLRELLRELYPAALRAFPDPGTPLALAVLERLPDPVQVSQSQDAVVEQLRAAGFGDAEAAVAGLRTAVAEMAPRRSPADAVATTVRAGVAAVRSADNVLTGLVNTIAGHVEPRTGARGFLSPLLSGAATGTRPASAPPVSGQPVSGPPVSAPPVSDPRSAAPPVSGVPAGPPQAAPSGGPRFPGPPTSPGTGAEFASTGPDPHGHMPHGQMPPVPHGATAPDHTPPFTPGQTPQGQTPRGQMPPVPHGQTPPGQMPSGQMPSGQMPSGRMPPVSPTAMPASPPPAGFPSPASGPPAGFPSPASGPPAGFPSPASGPPAALPSSAPPASPPPASAPPAATPPAHAPLSGIPLLSQSPVFTPPVSGSPTFHSPVSESPVFTPPTPVGPPSGQFPMPPPPPSPAGQQSPGEQPYDAQAHPGAVPATGPQPITGTPPWATGQPATPPPTSAPPQHGVQPPPWQPAAIPRSARRQAAAETDQGRPSNDAATDSTLPTGSFLAPGATPASGWRGGSNQEPHQSPGRTPLLPTFGSAVPEQTDEELSLLAPEELSTPGRRSAPAGSPTAETRRHPGPASRARVDQQAAGPDRTAAQPESSQDEPTEGRLGALIEFPGMARRQSSAQPTPPQRQARRDTENEPTQEYRPPSPRRQTPTDQQHSSPLSENDGDLLIFAQARSAWFTGDEEESAGDWRTEADAGWNAAEAASRPTVGGTTSSGLPRRVPSANLVPGAAPNRDRTHVHPVHRDAAQLAAHTAGYFSGWNRARQDTQDTSDFPSVRHQ